MPEVTIKYEKPETLKILKGLAEYFDFEIEPSSAEEKLLDNILVPADTKSTKEISVNGVTMIPGDPSIDITELKNIHRKKFRR